MDGLSRDLCWLLDNSNDHNILIYAGEVPNTTAFKAHTNILRARSLYFRAVFSSKHLSFNSKRDTKGSAMTEWYQPNISPEIFQIMLSGQLDLDGKNVERILEYLKAADVLWLHQLLDSIQTHLIKNHSFWLKKNFVEVFQLLHHHPTTFKKLHQYSQVILSIDSKSLFDSPHFLTLTEEMLISLLQKDYLQVEESFLWSKVIEWGIAQNNLDLNVSSWGSTDFSNLRLTLSKFISLIKFENMSYEDFNEKVQPYKPIFPIDFYENIKQYHMNMFQQSFLTPSRPFSSSSQQTSNSLISPPTPRTLNSIPSSPTSKTFNSIPSPPTQNNFNSIPSSPTLNTLNTLPSPTNQTSFSYPSVYYNSSMALQSNTPSTYQNDNSTESIKQFSIPKSKISLLSRSNLALLSGWIDGLDLSSPDDASYAVDNVPYKFKLLIRGSQHGFNDKIFHKRCDNKGPTIIVIKLRGVEGVTIGGYNPSKWQSPWIKKFEKCHHSFIFSL
ncbi:3842_t:CDS:2, partial [Scutellospora calospora]